MNWWTLILVALGVLAWLAAAIGLTARIHLGYLGAALIVSGVWLVPAVNAV